MARKKETTSADAFNATLRLALEHFHDPGWLAENSPMATVYFLGDHAHKTAISDRVNMRSKALRGEALQTVLRDAVMQLWPGVVPTSRDALAQEVEQARLLHGNRSEKYAFMLLELRYFRQYFAPDIYPYAAVDMPTYLSVSTGRFYAHLAKAIEQLARILLLQVQPTLRLEQLPLDIPLIGRKMELGTCLADLHAGKSVAISGAGGVGKTTLATAVAHKWQSEAVFWYTFLPNLNDNLESLLFALSHFIQQWSHSSLWLQLLADQGQISNVEQLQGLLRADLQQMEVNQPLFCFDEVDMLHTSGGNPHAPAHAQVLAFLESLCDSTTVLLIGQRAYIDTRTHFALTPFDHIQTAQMLTQAGIEFSIRKQEQIQTYTGGLPRLIELIIVLIHSGDDIEGVLRLHKHAQARPLFHRLWRRLDQSEKEILMTLAVYRRAVPVGEFAVYQEATTSLQHRRILQINDHAEMILIAFVAALVYEEMLPEQLESLHNQAGVLRAGEGDFTAAAYHFWRAGENDTAVNVWFAHRDLEIKRGQATAALDIFRHISSKRLTGQPQKQLKIIQNQLYLLAGLADRVVEGMAQVTWHIDDALSTEAFTQNGQALQMLGRQEDALDAYQAVIDAINRDAHILADNHFERGRLFATQADFKAARNEVHRIRYTAARLEGIVEAYLGNYDAAQQHLTEALKQAQHIQAEGLMPDIHYWLTMVAGRVGNLSAAKYHAEASMAYYKKIGNRVRLEGMRAELAGIYLNVGQYEQVIAPSEQALKFFERIGHEDRISSLCNNLAEAYLETGQFDKARQYVNRVLRMENMRSRPFAMYTLGLIHQRQGRFDDAAVAFQQGINIAQQNGDKFIEAYLHRLNGRLHLEQKQLDQSRAALSKALALFEEMGIEREINVTQSDLAMLTTMDSI